MAGDVTGAYFNFSSHVNLKLRDYCSQIDFIGVVIFFKKQSSLHCWYYIGCSVLKRVLLKTEVHAPASVFKLLKPIYLWDYQRNVMCWIYGWCMVVYVRFGVLLALICTLHAGMGSRLVESLRDEYPFAMQLSACVAPSVRGENPMQSYNCLLCLQHLYTHCDAVLLMENDLLVKCCQEERSSAQHRPPTSSARSFSAVTVDDLNRYSAEALAGLLLPTDSADPRKDRYARLYNELRPVAQSDHYVQGEIPPPPGANTSAGEGVGRGMAEGAGGDGGGVGGGDGGGVLSKTELVARLSQEMRLCTFSPNITIQVAWCIVVCYWPVQSISMTRRVAPVFGVCHLKQWLAGSLLMLY